MVAREQNRTKYSPPIPTMDRTLWCLVQGDSDIFDVKVPLEACVIDLKRVIWGQGKELQFRGMSAKDLELWKVHYLQIPT